MKKKFKYIVIKEFLLEKYIVLYITSKVKKNNFKFEYYQHLMYFHLNISKTPPKFYVFFVPIKEQYGKIYSSYLCIKNNRL